MESKPGNLCLTALVVIGLVTPAALLHGQKVVEGKGFKFAEYYDPPHETQMKSLLEGAKAVPQPGGRIFQITDARLQTFRVTGEGELVVEAPECSYDANERSVSSAGPLRLRTGDGRFYLEGEGFLWQQTNSSLHVSNRVHTVVHSEVASGQGAGPSTNALVPAAGEIHILSDQFDYAVKSGQAVYREDVRVSGTNMTLTAGTLTVDLPMGDRRLQSLIATENVAVDYLIGRTRTQARGQRASYAADTDQLHITGQPTWRADQREGRGDELLLDRKIGSFTAAGHAWLKMPGQGAAGSSFLPSPTLGATPGPRTTNQFVEILSDTYVIRTNSAVFGDDVRVKEWRDDKLQGKMSCALLTAAFSGTNELQQLVAEKDVSIESETNRFSAGRAVYTGTNGMLVLTEDPAWQAGARQGRGDVILVDVPRNEMFVHTNATMRLPADELGKSGGIGPAALRKPSSGIVSNQFAVISAEEYAVGPEKGRFQRHVRIDHPQMKWAAESVTAWMPAVGGRIARIVAEEAVAFDLIDDRGQKVHGTGDKAVYSYQQTTTATNETMELTGSPAVLTASTNIIGRNNVVLLNLTTHTITAPGRYTIRGTLASSTTDSPPAQKRKRKR